MTGQAVNLSNGQFYSTVNADTVIAGAGYETVSFSSFSGGTFTNGGGTLIADAGSDVVADGDIFGGGTFVGSHPATVIIQATGPSTVDASAATVFVGGAAASIGPSGVLTSQPADFTLAANGSLTVQSSTGAVVDVWANNTNMRFIGEDAYRPDPDIENISSTNFDGGSSNSTVVAGAAVTPGSSASVFPLAGLYVENGGVLHVQGASNNVQIVATSGSNTVDGSAATGANDFFASSGNTSLLGGAGNDWFVAGTGSATIDAGSALSGLVVLNGNAGGSDLLTGWLPADPIYLFGYGANDVMEETVSGGSLRLGLTDGTQITLAGMTSLGSGQLHLG